MAESQRGPIQKPSGRSVWKKPLRWLRERVGRARGRPDFDFDALARDMARGVSRRQVLGRLAGGLVGAMLAPLRLEMAAAAPSSRAACTIFCEQNFSNCIGGCSAALQAGQEAVEAAFRACKAACPHSGPGVDACNQACEATHLQQTFAVLQAVVNP